MSHRKPSYKPRSEDELPHPEPRLQAIEPPEHVRGYARELWLDLSPILTKAGRLRPEDIPGFTVLCDAWKTFRTYQDVAEAADPVSVNARSGGTKIHPAVAAKSAAAKVLDLWCANFLMHPLSRHRSGVKDEPPHPPTLAETLRTKLAARNAQLEARQADRAGRVRG